MAVLMLIFMICATRTNIVYTLIFLSLLVVFLLLSSAYWSLAGGKTTSGNRCVKVNIAPCLYLDKIHEVNANSTFLAFRGRELRFSLRAFWASIC